MKCALTTFLGAFLTLSGYAQNTPQPYEVSFQGELVGGNDSASTMVIRDANIEEVELVRAKTCGASIPSSLPYYDWIGHRVDDFNSLMSNSLFECQCRDNNFIKVATLKLTQRGRDVVVNYGKIFFYVECKAGTVPGSAETVSAEEMAKRMLGVIDCHGKSSADVTPTPTSDYASAIGGSGSAAYGIKDPVFRVTPSVSRTPQMRATLSVTGYAEEGVDDFPIPVRISEARIPGFSYAHGLPQGIDFRFFSADGLTEYPRDIERYDTNGESIVWVKLPRFEPNASFTFVWGGDGSPIPSTNVWQGYVGVWHMDEENGSIADATGHDLTAEPYKNSSDKGNPKSVAGEGVVGNARLVSDLYTQNEGQRLRVAYNDNLKLGGSFTASCWIKSVTNNVTYARLFSNKHDGTLDSGWEIHGTQSEFKSLRVRANSDQNYAISGDVLPSVYKTWRYLTVVYDQQNIAIYEDGAFIASGTVSEAGIVPDVKKPLDIGGGGVGNGGSFNGLMDEVRIFKGTTTLARVKAEYLTHTNAALVSSVMTGSLEKLAADSVRVQVGHLLSGQACRLVAQLLKADGTIVGEEVVLAEEASAGESFTHDWTNLDLDTTYVVLVKAKGVNDAVIGEVTFKIAQRKKIYKLLADDTTTSSSFGGSDETHPSQNNWQNIYDASDTISVPSRGYDYVVEGKSLRTSAGSMIAARTFAGDRLTLRNNANLNSKQEGYNPVSFNDLVVEDATILQSVSPGYLSCIWAKLTIPEGKTCTISMKESDTRAFRLQGSLVGSGLLKLGPKNLDNTGFSVGLETDMSAFDGSIEFARQPKVAFFSSWREPRELPTLVTNSISMHDSQNGRSSAYYFDDSFSLVSTNRGITITTTQAGTHRVSVKRGCTVSLKNPLYGSGPLVKIETGTFFDTTYDGTNSTLRLEADRGDWTGTLTVEGGTVELAGLKPLGEGTLNTTAEAAKAVVDVEAIGGSGCFVKNIVEGSHVALQWKTCTDFTTDVKALRVPVSTELKKDDIVFDLDVPTSVDPQSLMVRRSVQNDEIVFSVGSKRGMILIFR